MMIATYERGKTLNVRKAPNANAPVVLVMGSGEKAECLEVRDGWAKLKDGYANASFLLIAEEAAQEPEAEPEPEPEQAEEPTDDEAAELRKMTNAQLYDLAEQSGIAVKKGAKKEELIAAILADE